jgi:demethylmenaquinone methyltransferase/2-methoxy-6-polyprenyl-1,4-benzoquinol methylase
VEAAINRRALGLFAGLGGDYDRWAAVLSFGQDPRWRRFLVDRVPVTAEARVLDVATGTAAVARRLVRRYGCRVTGIDQSPAMLDGARTRLVDDPAAERIELLECSAESLPFADAEFDALTFTYLLRYVEDPEATLRELVRVVRPGGPVAYLEFGLPDRGPLRLAWGIYVDVLLPLAGRLISPAWHEVGRFLGPSIREFCERYPPEELAAAFARAGLDDVGYRRMSLGGGIVVWGRRASGG